MAITDSRAKELIDLGQSLFTAKAPLDSLWQEIAMNFYPERADFTTDRYIGREWADHLMDSHPVLLRRDLGNSISSMLRPRNRPWFRATTLDDELDQIPKVSEYLDYLNRTIRRNMYAPKSNFVRATKEGDHDFVTFGQTVISVEEDVDRDTIQYRCHHLKSCAWLENKWQRIDHLHFKDRMSARTLMQTFGDKNHESVKRAAKDAPGTMFDIRRCVMPSDEYDYMNADRKKGGKKLPFVAIYYDASNQKMLRESPLAHFPYCVPRWHTIPHSQYAWSSATAPALPDARAAQQLALTLMEAGEKAIDPPTVATEEAVGEINLQAGGTTWVDYSYDEKLGAAIRAIDIRYDIQAGFAMRQDLREMLAKALYIDKLTLPSSEKDMTAYETARRLEEHVRNLLPIFEPMEVEYNTPILDTTFAVLKNLKKIDFTQLPRELLDVEFGYEFESPIQENMKRVKMTQFREAIELYVAAREANKETGVVVLNPIKTDVALADSTYAIGLPAKWRKSDEEFEAEMQQIAQSKAVDSAMQQANAGAEIAGKVGDAAQKLNPPEQQLALPAPDTEMGDQEIDDQAIALMEALNAIPDEEFATA